jgi:hypothetical protein
MLAFEHWRKAGADHRMGYMSNTPEPPVYEGSCFCGHNRFRFRGRPFWITYDHDDDCRKAIGAPLVVWIGYPVNDVEILAGVPAIYRSSPGVRRHFCDRCGTSIAYEDDGLPGEIYYTIGVFDEPGAFEPEAHAFYPERLPWLKMEDGLPNYPGHTRPRVVKAQKPFND